MKYRETLCCADCFHHIALQDVDAAGLWLDLCEIESHFKGHNSVLVFKEHMKGSRDALRALENLGFVVSTETLKLVYIKLKGFKRGIYCLKAGKHE